MFKSINKRINGSLSIALINSIKDAFISHDNLSFFSLKGAFLRYMGHKKYYHRNRYKFLCNEFSKGELLDFKIGCLPKIDNENHRSIFMLEFGDLLAPYLWPRRYNIWNQIWPMVEGNYEQFGITVKENDVVIDAGANMGVFSTFAAAKGATVYAFEPIPYTFDYLNKTIHVNSHLSGTIVPVPYALMSYSGTVEMEFAQNNIGGTSAIIDRKTGQKTKVPCITIDEWVEANNIPRIDFIKADIEGAERYLLSGATQVLQIHKPRLAICTYHLPDDPQVIREIIMKANPTYKVYQGKCKLFAE